MRLQKKKKENNREIDDPNAQTITMQTNRDITQNLTCQDDGSASHRLNTDLEIETEPRAKGCKCTSKNT